MKKVLVLVLLVACGTDSAGPIPDATAPMWSCRMFTDCAGQVVILEKIVGGSTQQDAEALLVDVCESATCSGALACHAICEPQ